MTDQNGNQSMQYAPGSLIVPETPTLNPLQDIVVENYPDSILLACSNVDASIDFVEVKVINPRNGHVVK